MPQNKTLLIGHRGAAAHLPENTLESMHLAFAKFGADSIEFDIRFTKDGVPVVIHDATLDRTTDGKGYLRSYRFEEIQRFDAGYFFDPKKNGSFPCRGKGLLIPSFEKLLKHFPDKKLCVEIKEKEPALTDAVMALIKKHGAEKRCVVGSKYEAVSRQMREKYPDTLRFTSSQEIVIAYLAYKSGKKLAAAPTAVASMPLERCGFHFDEEGFVAELHRRGLKVYYWTINDPKVAATLISRNADGIITDDPTSFPKL